MSFVTWKEKLDGQIPSEMAREIDQFEAQMHLRKQGKIEERVFAETRLRRGTYGQRYDNGHRHDGIQTQDINFPANPTAQCVELPFFEKIIALAREHGIYVVHDLAYADICFDGWKAPSIMQVPGARDVAVEFFTMSKSYNMAGWRIGFMVGNKDLVNALSRIKGYHDYGTFTPIQVAAIAALEGPQDCVAEIAMTYQKRRDVLVKGLHEAGWLVDIPKASMYVWAKIPDAYKELGSLEFTKKLLAKAKVSVSPGIGFGEFGDQYVRFAMIENESRTRQAIRGIKQMFRDDGLR